VERGAERVASSQKHNEELIGIASSLSSLIGFKLQDHGSHFHWQQFHHFIWDKQHEQVYQAKEDLSSSPPIDGRRRTGQTIIWSLWCAPVEGWIHDPSFSPPEMRARALRSMRASLICASQQRRRLDCLFWREKSQKTGHAFEELPRKWYFLV